MFSFRVKIGFDIYIFKLKIFELHFKVGVLLSLSLRLLPIFNSLAVEEATRVIISMLSVESLLTLVKLPRPPPPQVGDQVAFVYLACVCMTLKKIISYPGPCEEQLGFFFIINFIFSILLWIFCDLVWLFFFSQQGLLVDFTIPLLFLLGCVPSPLS